MPQVSVIIPTYNRANLLPQAINSVLVQTMSDFELLVVDDGSTDQTAEIVAGYDDDRIRYLYQHNTGRSAARNLGLSSAQASYVAFLDSDDLFTSNKLLSQSNYLERHPEISVVLGGYERFDEHGRALDRVCPWKSHPNLTIKTWLFDCPTFPGAIMVQKKWLEHVQGFDLETEIAEDWDLCLRLASSGCQMGWIQETVCRYRIHAGNSVKEVADHRRGMLKMFEKFFSSSNLPSDVREIQEQIMADAYLTAAGREYAVGMFEQAREDVASAMALDPTLNVSNWEQSLDRLLKFARNPVIAPNSMAYIDSIFNHLPPKASKFRAYYRRGIARVAAGMMFAAWEEDNMALVRSNLRKIVLYDPGWMLNRGVLSIAIRTLLLHGYKGHKKKQRVDE